MPDAHIVDFTDPHPDRDRGCWAAWAGSPCNRQDVDDAVLCPDHGAAYRQHPSHQEPPSAPEPSWLSRVVDAERAREHFAGPPSPQVAAAVQHLLAGGRVVVHEARRGRRITRAILDELNGDR